MARFAHAFRSNSSALSLRSSWSAKAAATEASRTNCIQNDFVARVLERLREAGRAAPGPLPGGGRRYATDTELLGHWWYEGVEWLAAVVEEAAAQGLALVRLDDASALSAPRALPQALREEWRATSWGHAGDLSTWSQPGVAELAFGARAAELQVLGAGPSVPVSALRELLALQSSDWAFLITRELAVSYGKERFHGHRDRLARALSGADPAAVAAGALRNIAPDARTCDLVGP